VESPMIRIGVLGAGHWGPNLIRNFHNQQQSEVGWIIERDPQRLAQVAQHFPGLQVGNDPQQVLDDPKVDAVVIATPTTTHYALARAALEHGKHVLVEKPMATESRQATELCALAANGRLVLMVGHVFVYNPAVQRVKKYLDTGDLGRVYYLSMVRTNLGPIRTDVNAAWDLAAHDVSIANYWLGSEPESVWATGHAWLNPGVEDAVFATLCYPGDVLAHLHVSWLNPRKDRVITVVGERRMLTFDDMKVAEPLRLYDKQVTDDRTRPPYSDTFDSFRASVHEGDITIPRVGHAEPLRAECDHFLECIKNGTPSLSGGAEGAAVVRVLEAMQRSMRAGGRAERVAP